MESAQDEALGRPLAALPWCVFAEGTGRRARIGVGIGDRVLDLLRCAELNLLQTLRREVVAACGAAVLNPVIECGAAAVGELRARVREVLGGESDRSTAERALVPLADVELLRPVDVPNFADFYASREHAWRVGEMFRPESPLLPNYDWVPIAYHGRASSVVVSGTPVMRPWGQIRALGDAEPRFTHSQQLDYEMELGAYVYGGNALGETIPVGEAAGQIFGVTLVNDWSARDVQAWEYQPLGPFLGKSFATSVGGWVMPWEALEPYRVRGRTRRAGEPEALAYLREAPDDPGAIAVRVEALLATPVMRERGSPEFLLGRGEAAGLYWTMPQMIAHHTSNGCNLVPGDLLGTGTISGAGEGERGCLLEITRRGEAPVMLPSGEKRRFLEDGDEVVLRGFCKREGLPLISFGECRGRVLAARDRVS